MRYLVAACAAFALLIASCGGDDDESGEVLGFIDGTEDGAVKYPVLELWDIPECTCDKLIANTPHGTRVKVLDQKQDCPGTPHEVELLNAGHSINISDVLTLKPLFGQTCT